MYDFTLDSRTKSPHFLTVQMVSMSACRCHGSPPHANNFQLWDVEKCRIWKEEPLNRELNNTASFMEFFCMPKYKPSREPRALNWATQDRLSLYLPSMKGRPPVLSPYIHFTAPYTDNVGLTMPCSIPSMWRCGGCTLLLKESLSFVVFNPQGADSVPPFSKRPLEKASDIAKPYVSITCLAASLRRFELLLQAKCWSNSVGSLYQSLLWAF